MSKRDPAVAPLHKRLLANAGSPMAIDALLHATSAKGLKVVGAPLRTGTLDRLRADDRFEVSEELGAPGGWMVSLAKPAATISSAGLRALVDEAERDTAVDDAPPADDEPPAPIDASVPTIGERLAAAEANGQPPIESTLAQPISRNIRDAEPGQRVVHSIFGSGFVRAINDRTILVAFDAHGDKDLTLDFAGEKMRFESEVISNATPEAAAPLTDREVHDLLFTAMQAYQAAGAALAASFYGLKRTELEQDGALKQTRETLKELQKTMASHMAAVPTLETIAQRTIAFDTQCETGPGDQPQAEGGEASAWPYQVPPEHTMTPEAAGVDIDQCIARILLEIPPSEKPMQIKEHVVTVKGSDYLPRQASPDCTRVFLQPVVSRDTWQQIHEEKFGRALKDFDQNPEAKEQRQAGGEDCGRTVKVGRLACVMGPESEGLVIVAAAVADAPAEPEHDAEDGAPTGGDWWVNDRQFHEAVREVFKYRRAGPDFLRRKCSVGYSKATRYTDKMEEIGLIGPARGEQAREILMEWGGWLVLLVQEDFELPDGDDLYNRPV